MSAYCCIKLDLFINKVEDPLPVLSWSLQI